MKDGCKTVAIPAGLYGRVEERIKASGFSSVDEYVTFVLEQVVSEEETRGDVSSEEEAEVKKRLKALGYLE